MIRSAVTKLAIFGIVIAAAACSGPRYIPVPGALPTPQDTAAAMCRQVPSIGGSENTGRAQQDTEAYRNCMYARGWARADDDRTPALVRASASQVSIPGSRFAPGGESPIEIGDDQIYCLHAITRGPAYRPVLAHIANPYTGLYSDAERTNEAVPTRFEASLLAGYGEEADRCNGRMLQDMARAAPRFVGILQRRTKAAKLISVDLINRKITFGQAARRQRASIQATRDAILAAASPRPSRSTP